MRSESEVFFFLLVDFWPLVLPLVEDFSHFRFNHFARGICLFLSMTERRRVEDTFRWDFLFVLRPSQERIFLSTAGNLVIVSKRNSVSMLFIFY